MKRTVAGIENQQQSPQTEESPEGVSAAYGNRVDEMALFFRHPNPIAWPLFYIIARNASPNVIGVAIWATREDMKMPDSDFPEDVMYHYIFSAMNYSFH
jgi:hypothetical protein